ncbi:hypothetical protein MASR2M47_41540 [Draconibacterium sp.]|jgi:hypothetical protein
MKVIKTILMSLIVLCATHTIHAQTITSSPFLGKWKVNITGTPSGDAEMIMNIVQTNDSIVGTIGTEGQEPKKIDKVVIDEKKMSVYWKSGEYDVYIKFDLVDENKLEGSLIELFNATAKRIVE